MAAIDVPFLDLGAGYRELKGELDQAYGSVMSSGSYLLGRQLESFESEFADYVATAHCAGVGSGLDALSLALRAVGVGVGDEVIVPAHTFVATWLAVSSVGAIPVPVEPDQSTFNIDPSAISEALTERTKAIVPVHLYGRPADMDEILEVALRNGLKVVEDAAQAHGARYRGARVGALGDAAAWSFYPGKNLGAFADAGAVTTNSADVDNRVRMFRNYGSRVKYRHQVYGVNSRMDELQAAFLRVKLRWLDIWNERRRVVAHRYCAGLSGMAELALPDMSADAEPSWHLYVVRTPYRDALQQVLLKRGVEALIHYPVPPLRQGVYAGLALPPSSFPVADRLAEEVLSLPIGPHLDERGTLRVLEEVTNSMNLLAG